MIITIVISMLIVVSYHCLIGCSKQNRNKTPSATSKKQSQTTLAPTPTAAAAPVKTPNAAPEPSRVAATVVERDDRDSTRTKAGTKKGSKEPDSTDDAFKDLAARLAKKEKADLTADSLLGDDDENPIAAFQMPERPVVDVKQDGAKLANIVEMEKKKPVASRPKRVPSTPQGPVTARERSMADDPRSKMVTMQLPPISRKSNRKSKMSMVTDQTQSEKHAKAPLDVDNTQAASGDEGEPEEMGKTQGASTMGKEPSPSLKSKKKEEKKKSQEHEPP